MSVRKINILCCCHSSNFFFSGSSSFLQVTKITTISRMSSKFVQIRHLTAELAALECLKNKFLVLWPRGHSSIFNFDQILKKNKKIKKKK